MEQNQGEISQNFINSSVMLSLNSVHFSLSKICVCMSRYYKGWNVVCWSFVTTCHLLCTLSRSTTARASVTGSCAVTASALFFLYLQKAPWIRRANQMSDLMSTPSQLSEKTIMQFWLRNSNWEARQTQSGTFRANEQGAVYYVQAHFWRQTMTLRLYQTVEYVSLAYYLSDYYIIKM